MLDNTVKFAVNQGIRTARINRATSAASVRKVNQFVYTPDEMAAALERERAKRIEADIAAYRARKCPDE